MSEELKEYQRKDRLNYMTFENAVKPYCRGKDNCTKASYTTSGRKNLGKDVFDSYILLSAAMDDDEVSEIIEGGENHDGYTSARLSRYRHGKEAIPSACTNTFMRENAYDLTVDMFDSTLCEFVSTKSMVSIVRVVNAIICCDPTIPKEYRENFNRQFEKIGYTNNIPKELFVSYLADVFIFAMIRYEDQDILRLQEEELQSREPKLDPIIQDYLVDIKFHKHTERINEALRYIFGEIPIMETVDDIKNIHNDRRLPISERDLYQFIHEIIEYRDKIDPYYLAYIDSYLNFEDEPKLHNIASDIEKVCKDYIDFAKSHDYFSPTLDVKCNSEYLTFRCNTKDGIFEYNKDKKFHFYKMSSGDYMFFDHPEMKTSAPDNDTTKEIDSKYQKFLEKNGITDESKLPLEQRVAMFKKFYDETSDDDSSNE